MGKNQKKIYLIIKVGNNQKKNVKREKLDKHKKYEKWEKMEKLIFKNSTFDNNISKKVIMILLHYSIKMQI